MLANRVNAPQPLAGFFLVALVALLGAAGSSSASSGESHVGHLSSVAWAQASAARNFEESLRMRITKKKGKRVAARGRATGTVSGKASFKLVLKNGSQATFTFYGQNAHGTLSGAGVARYRINGAISSYTGKITSLQGSGRYARAASRGISFSGTINRRTYDVRLSLSGRWNV